MHWSHPEARDFLVWLAWRGGTAYASTYQGDIQRLTGRRRLHPNNGRACAWRLLEEIGVPRPETAVRWRHLTKDEQKREVGVYHMRAEVLIGMKRLVAMGHDEWLMSRAQVLAHRDELLRVLAPAPRPANPVQPALF